LIHGENDDRKTTSANPSHQTQRNEAKTPVFDVGNRSGHDFADSLHLRRFLRVGAGESQKLQLETLSLELFAVGEGFASALFLSPALFRVS